MRQQIQEFTEPSINQLVSSGHGQEWQQGLIESVTCVYSFKTTKDLLSGLKDLWSEYQINAGTLKSWEIKIKNICIYLFILLYSASEFLDLTRLKFRVIKWQKQKTQKWMNKRMHACINK